MANKIHNLDEAVVEFFDFIIKGHTYRFRHMNTEEMTEMKTLVGDEEKTKDYLFKFISKIDDSSPEFTEIAKKMLSPHWNKFAEMLKSEVNG